MNDVSANCLEMTQTLHFRLRPAISALSKEWAETDAFWRTTPAAPAAMAAADKKKKK